MLHFTVYTDLCVTEMTALINKRLSFQLGKVTFKRYTKNLICKTKIPYHFTELSVYNFWITFFNTGDMQGLERSLLQWELLVETVSLAFRREITHAVRFALQIACAFSISIDSCRKQGVRRESSSLWGLWWLVSNGHLFISRSKCLPISYLGTFWVSP